MMRNGLFHFRKTDSHVLLFLILCVLAIVFVWCIYVYRGDTKWESLDLTHMGYYHGWEITAEESGYGIVNYGPGLTLQNGTYVLEWEIDTDGTNQVLISTANHANCIPDSFTVSKDNHSGKVEFQLLEESDNLEFLIDFETGTYLSVGTISLRGPRCSDRAWLLTFILLFAIAVLTMFYRGLLQNRTDCAVFIVLSITVLLASLPALRTQIYLGADGPIHIARLRSLVSSMYQGQFPVRVSAVMFNGYGDVFPVFYPTLFLYPAAFLMMLHASTQFAYQTLIVGLTGLTVFTMFVCARRIAGGRNAGVAATILYVFAPYRLTNVYIRVALGEALAMAIIPLFILGLYECIKGDISKWPVLSVSCALLVNVHILSSLLIGIFATIIVCCYLPLLIREKRFLYIVLAVSIALLLCLSVLLPMITYVMQGIDTSNLSTKAEYNTLTAGNLLGISNLDPVFFENGSLSVGTISILLVAGLIVYLISNKKRYTGDTVVAGWSAFFGTVFILMTTSVFPWAWLSRATNGLTDIIQFPFRLLAFADICYSFAAGYAVSVIIDILSKSGISRLNGNQKMVVAMLFFLGMNAVYSLSTIDRVWDMHPQYKKGNNTNEIFLVPDYFLEGSNIYTTKREKPVIQGNASIVQYQKKGTDIRAVISAETESMIVFPMFAFDGFQAYFNGYNMPIQQDKERRIALVFPEPSYGELFITFKGKAVWKIADVVSLLTLFWLVCLCMRKAKSQDVGLG